MPQPLAMMMTEYEDGIPLPFASQAALHDSAIEFMQSQFRDKNDDVMPAMFIFVWTDKLVFCPAPWGNEREKSMMLAVIRSFLRDMPCLRYSMISETWISRRRDDDGKGEMKPREDPDHLDGVLVITMERNESTIISSQWLVEDGRLEPFEGVDSYKTMSGQMTELMGDRDEARHVN